jgi:hypothetical protein
MTTAAAPKNRMTALQITAIAKRAGFTVRTAVEDFGGAGGFGVYCTQSKGLEVAAALRAAGLNVTLESENFVAVAKKDS